MNLKPVLSYAGTWFYSDYPGSAIIPLYSQINLGRDKIPGLILAGCSYAGPDNKFYRTTKIAILDQNTDGTLKLNTQSYVDDTIVNGAGSIIVSDFNGDNINDIFLIAACESPLVPKSSTVYLSGDSNRYEKVSVLDSVIGHHATLVDFNGIKTIITAGYHSVDPYYQFNHNRNNFDVLTWGNDHDSPDGNIKSFYGSTLALADFDGDNQPELIIGDDAASPGLDFVLNGPRKLAVYEIVDGNHLANFPSFSTNMHFDNDPIYKQYSTATGTLSHNYRIWSDDFNYDGMLDILAGVSIEFALPGFQRSKLQMIQNIGDLQFLDKTEELAKAYSEKTTNVDYAMQIIDIDHSGINSYLLGDVINPTPDSNSNYLFLNDGTGKLYAALHNEFVEWGYQVRDFLNSINVSYGSYFVTPRFIAYQTVSGSINYLAEWGQANNDTAPLVNVPVGYNPTVDFLQNVIIEDRNHSSLLRTWAGSDVFYDSNANFAKETKINGGLGFDFSIYSNKLSYYKVENIDDGLFSVKQAYDNPNTLVDDILINIERLRFSDVSVALDFGRGQVAGTAYRLYRAALDREPDLDGLASWINALDHGLPLTSVAKGFLTSQEFKAKYGGEGASNEVLVNLLYKNVLHRAPDGDGYSAWVNALNAGAWTKEAVLIGFSESSENIQQTQSLVSNGIKYHEWWL